MGKSVCRPYVEDMELGSLPKWNDGVDMSINAACLTTHQSTMSIPEIVNEFEENICKPIPYCRMAVLPLSGERSINAMV